MVVPSRRPSTPRCAPCTPPSASTPTRARPSSTAGPADERRVDRAARPSRVVGATGQVGGVMRRLLRRARLPGRRASASSPRPARPARTLPWRRRARSSSRTPRPPTSRASTSRCSPRAAPPRRRWRRAFAAAGAVVVDNSSAWRMDPDVPLVVSEVNPRRRRDRPARASSPTRTAPPWPRCRCSSRCTTRPACAAWSSSTYQAVSGSGLAGVDELDEQVARRSATRRRRARPRRRGGRLPGAEQVRRADRLQRACRWPARSSTTARARPTRSRSSATRAARSSASPTCAVSGTCVRVPVFTGHSLSINAEFARPLSRRARAPSCCAGAPGVELADVPTPLQAAGADPIVRRPDPPGPGRRRTAAGWRCSSATTTCARAPRSTPSRSPSCVAASL